MSEGFEGGLRGLRLMWACGAGGEHSNRPSTEAFNRKPFLHRRGLIDFCRDVPCCYDARMLLDRDEYVEQAYFFRVLVDRMRENVPMQEVLRVAEDEVLSTTKLPLAISYLRGEIQLTGTIAPAMRTLGHYFSAYQTFVIASAEEEAGRFDMRVALNILRFLAEFMGKEPSPQAIFLYQFEVLCRNRLGYGTGLSAMAKDPIYDAEWTAWIRDVRRQIGLVGLAELIYVRSEHYLQYRSRKAGKQVEPEKPILFGEKEGKIALANRKKEPLLLFSAMQRHLEYPTVPKLEKADRTEEIVPLLVRRMERLEHRMKLLEEEQQGGIDITKFYTPPDSNS